MRLCANVPAQHAIQTALGGRQSIRDLVLPGGRLLEQRDAAITALEKIKGVSCVKPKVQGTGFNWPTTDHLRIVTLPHAKDLTEAIGRLGNFLSTYDPAKK
jgi:alanine-synthesizing transaminase